MMCLHQHLRKGFILPYSVVIADDHSLVRKSIGQIVDAHHGLECVGSAADGVDALVLVKSLKPDLLVLDAAMPRTTGVEVIEEVRRWSSSTKIAVVTGVTSHTMLQHILDSAVEGIFLKSEDADGWGDEFYRICEGGRRESPPLSKRFDQAVRPESLTRRERQILFAIARGESNAAMGDRLGISPNTVDKHRTAIMRKLNAHSATELVTRAFRDGLLGGAEEE